MYYGHFVPRSTVNAPVLEGATALVSKLIDSRKQISLLYHRCYIYMIRNGILNERNMFALEDLLDKSDRTKSNTSNSGKRPSQRTSSVESRRCLSRSRTTAASSVTSASTSTCTSRGALAGGKRSRRSSRRASGSAAGLASSRS